MQAKYYPKVDIRYTVTPFGVQEANVPNLYATPIPNTVTSAINSIRIDLLDVLKSEWGEPMFENRELAYTLFSGKVETETLMQYRVSADDYYRFLFRSYYDRFAVFQNAVDLEMFFGDKNKLFLTRFISQVRNKVSSYQRYIESIVENTNKGKVLMVTHDYMYIAYRDKIPDILIKRGLVIQNV